MPSETKRERSERERAELLQQQYLGLGPDRSTQQLSELTGVAVPQLGKLRRAHDWDLHAAEYDRQQLMELHRRTSARTEQEWDTRSQQQLGMASLLRKKAFEYLQHREVEGEVTDEGQWLIRPIETQKGLMVLKFLDHANQTERLLLGQPTDRIEHQGEVLTTERLQVIVAQSLQDNRAWRAEQGLPGLEEEDPLEGYSAQ